MLSLSMIKGLLLLIIFVIKPGHCNYCYECSSEIEFGSHDACSTGKTWYLRRVQCRIPSVCATYSFTSLNKNRPTITSVVRGCQAIEYGSTCEDIFNDLRSRGLFDHGHHECSTCSSDFCNSSETINLSSQIFFISIFLSVSFNYLACR